MTASGRSATMFFFILWGLFCGKHYYHYRFIDVDKILKEIPQRKLAALYEIMLPLNVAWDV